MDLSNETIKDLFYKQIRDLTLKNLESFDLQFSGKLLEKWGAGKFTSKFPAPLRKLRDDSDGRRIIARSITRNRRSTG